MMALSSTIPTAPTSPPRQLVWSKEDVAVNGAAPLRYRVLPWDSSLTGLPSGARVKFHVEVRPHSISSALVRVYDVFENSPTAAWFAEPMRDKERDVANVDGINLVDTNGWTVSGSNAPVISTSNGAVVPIVTPDFVMTQDQSNQRFFGIEVQELNGLTTFFTIQVFAEVL